MAAIMSRTVCEAPSSFISLPSPANTHTHTEKVQRTGEGTIDCTRNGLATLYKLFRHPPYGHVIKLRMCGVCRSPPAQGLSYRASRP